MLDKANAMSELNLSVEESGVDALAAKYDAAPDTAIQSELEALKAQMGLK